jgi:Urease accessory protein UreF
MLDIAESIYNIPILSTYRKRLKEKILWTFGNRIYDGWSLPRCRKETTIVYYLYSTIVSLVQNAVRAIPLGQTAGQKVIYAFQEELKTAAEKIMKLDELEFGVVSPGLEVSQMQHERVGIRIFSS